MKHQRRRAGEIWLRGNLRPVAGLAAMATVLATAVIAVVAVATASLAYTLIAAACFGIVEAVVALLASAAAQPRLERVGDRLRIRLSPAVVQEVPLDAVECFFQGSNPIDRSGEPTCGEHATFRVNTIVMRLAERAADFARRTTFTPWGTWDDGYVVFDGRWCEPLSAELAKQLGRRLVEAKRSPAAGDAAAGATADGHAAAGVVP